MRRHNGSAHLRGNVFHAAFFFLVTPDKKRCDAAFNERIGSLRPPLARPELFLAACVDRKNRKGFRAGGFCQGLGLKAELRVFLINRVTEAPGRHHTVAPNGREAFRHLFGFGIKVACQRLTDRVFGVPHGLHAAPAGNKRRSDQSLQVNHDVVVIFSEKVSEIRHLPAGDRRKRMLSPAPEGRDNRVVDKGT